MAWICFRVGFLAFMIVDDAAIRRTAEMWRSVARVLAVARIRCRYISWSIAFSAVGPFSYVKEPITGCRIFDYQRGPLVPAILPQFAHFEVRPGRALERDSRGGTTRKISRAPVP